MRLCYSGSMRKKVLISGAGVAGLATALQLDTEKYDIHLVERADEFLSAGYAIILWKSGYDVLNHLLEHQEMPFIEPIEKAYFYGRSSLEHLHTTDSRGLIHSVNRSDLIDHLSAEYSDKIGQQKIAFKSQIKHIEQNETICRVQFDNSEIEEFDLVILADGMHSQMRDSKFITKHKEYPYKINYQWIELDGDVEGEVDYGFTENFAYLLYTAGSRAVLGIYDITGKTPRSEIEERIASTLADRTKVKFLHETATDFTVEEIAVDRAYDSKIILVGDAYHGHSPTIGFGTSAALEDGITLAIELNKIGSNSSLEELDQTLKKYENIRNARIQRIYRFSAVMEKLIISDSKMHVAIVTELLKLGAWMPFEDWFMRLLSSKIET